MAHQNFEQVEFGAGQFERSVFDAGLAFGRVQNDVADGNAVRRVVLFVAVLRTAQDGVDAGQEFARCAWFRNIIVRTHFQTDDAVDVVAFRGQHDDGYGALGAYVFQHVQTVHFRHHGV